MNISEYKILQVCTHFIGSSLYKKMLVIFDEKNICSDWYVPVQKNYIIKKADNKFNHLTIDPCFNGVDRLTYTLKQRHIIKNIKKRYNLSEYAILHGHTLFSSGYSCYEIHKQSGIPYIITITNTDINFFFKHIVTLRKKGINILKKAEKIIFFGKPYIIQLLDYVKDPIEKEIIQRKCVVIPSGIDEFWINNIYKSERKISNKKIKIISVASIDENKNHISTVKACELLIKKGYKISFTICGEILNKEIACNLNKYKFVTLTGRLSKEELIAEYRKHDIFCLNSITETFGLVYPEAMSQGLPIIYSKNQGFDQQFDEGIVGYSAEAKDFEDIANKIIMILEDYADISDRCKINVKAYSWSKIVETYINLYEESSNKYFLGGDS